MNNDDVRIDIKKMLEGVEETKSDDCCIYRVPPSIRRLKEEAYTPNVVSIGPFHHGRYQNMEQLKLIYCKAFLKRASANASLDTIIDLIEENEPKFRLCYSETLGLSKEELVKLILMDSGFIIELFCSSSDDISISPPNGEFLPKLSDDIILDLLLLENQIPFFVLDTLFTHSIGSVHSSDSKIPSFIKLTFDYFSYYNKFGVSPSKKTTINHFTDLIRIFHLQHPSEKRPERMSNPPVKHAHSATELREAGVRFKVNTESKCLLEFGFSGNVLEVPQLEVEDSTEILFRNMIALEQCHYPYESYITDYVTIWDFLVNTERDVDLLVRKKVVVNWLGDNKEVAKMFNGLGKNIFLGNFSSHYTDLCQRLDDHWKHPSHKWMASLGRDYCNTPWQTAASFAAILLLIFSLLQSICSVLQVLQQSHASSNTL